MPADQTSPDPAEMLGPELTREEEARLLAADQPTPDGPDHDGLTGKPYVLPCRNELEPDGEPCTGTLAFRPGEPQAKCSRCGGWEGRSYPRPDRPSGPVEPPEAPGPHPGTPEAAQGESDPLPEWERDLIEREAAARAAGLCCDLHGPHCEPPSELCCRNCTEARHPAHPAGVRCTWASDADVAFGQAVQRLAGDAPEVHDRAQGPILGRLVVRPDGLWWSDGDCYWHNVRQLLAGATEAVLVTPAAARVIEAARQFVRAWDADPFGPATSAAKARLAAAVDAMQAGPDGAMSESRSHGEPTTVVRGPGEVQVTPSPEPGDGPGWNQRAVDGLFELLAESTAIVEDRTVSEIADMLRARLADRDRLRAAGIAWASEHCSVEVERDRLREELAEETAERDDLRRRLRATGDACNQARNELAEVTAERNRLASRVEGLESIYAADEEELIRQRTIADQLRAQVSSLEAERDSARKVASGAVADAVRLEHLRSHVKERADEHRAELATARRDGAADALRWAAVQIDHRIYDGDDAGAANKLAQWAAEIRTGAREIPAPASGEGE